MFGRAVKQNIMFPNATVLGQLEATAVPRSYLIPGGGIRAFEGLSRGFWQGLGRRRPVISPRRLYLHYTLAVFFEVATLAGSGQGDFPEMHRK